jgi:hypothetical protein
MTKTPITVTEAAEKLIEAQHSFLVRRARAQIESIEFPTQKIGSVFDSAIEAGDRETAIVIACLVDDLLIDFLRKKITGVVSGGSDSLFGANAVTLPLHFDRRAVALSWSKAISCRPTRRICIRPCLPSAVPTE